MATATEPMPAAEVVLEAQPIEITADEFFGMIDRGLFAPERRVFHGPDGEISLVIDEREIARIPVRELLG
jgi:hypothetical protein